ncbi:MAG: MFS transporter [Caldilineaceae bacterium SB0675_bin_29]|uniref:MFS transporter n=1 Tax=Caldilineaceae bacterium SB0675_bin_29 TaxID=2605266 RepID=A0A6B1G494_9CHLR|nr:MFS transporter [Caldilineaceae bacterium SB0675_bin_29]
MISDRQADTVPRPRLRHELLTNTVLLVAGGHFLLELFHQYLPVFFPLYRAEFGLTYGQIGMITLVGTTTMSLAQPLFGFFIDRFDARRIAALSVMWVGLIMAVLGFSGNYWVLLIGVALAGFGSAAFHPAGASVVTKANDEGKRGRAVSFFAVGGNIGSAGSPLLLAIGLGLLGLKGTIVLLPVVVLAAIWLVNGLGQESRGAREAHRERQSRAGEGFLLGLVLIAVVAMTRAWFQLSLTTYLPTLLEYRGYSVVYGGQMLFVLSLLIGIGSLFGGILSDRFGRWQVLLSSFAMLGPAYWFFISSGGGVQFIYAGAIGFLLGCTYPTTVVVAQEVWPRGMAMASGLVMGLGWWPGGLGATFTGWVADQMALETALEGLVVAPVLGALLMAVFAVALQRRRRSSMPSMDRSSAV